MGFKTYNFTPCKVNINYADIAMYFEYIILYRCLMLCVIFFIVFFLLKKHCKRIYIYSLHRIRAGTVCTVRYIRRHNCRKRKILLKIRFFNFYIFKQSFFSCLILCVLWYEYETVPQKSINCVHSLVQILQIQKS